MASQDPSTAYTATPEKKSGSWFPSFSLPKLPDFFGTGATSAAPAPAAPATAVAEQSSVQPGGRRRRGRKMSKKAGRRTRRGKKGGLTPAEGVKFSDSDIREITRGTKADFPPVQVRKGKGGRRTRRVKKHSRC
jgi:hypothetical protein